jgi:hypothetical protein
MIPDFLQEKGAKWIVIRMLDRTEFLPLGDAEAEVIEFAFPFVETGFQQDPAFSMQFATIEAKIAGTGKEGHRKDGDELPCQRQAMALFWAELNIV